MRQETSATFTLPLERILEDHDLSVRVCFGDLDELAVQLMTEGQREPIEVREREGEYFLVDGHRRQRALARSRQLRIEREDGRFVVYEGIHPLRDAPGPVHPRFDPAQVPCRLANPERSSEDLMASKLVGTRGKPFTALERSLFLSRILRQGGSREAWAAQVGFSTAQVEQARALHPADPRLVEQVREGRLAPALALRLLRALPPSEQVTQIVAARARADRQGREKLAAQDFEWAEDPNEGREDGGMEATATHPVQARLNDLVARLGGVARSAPNRAAEERLSTLLLIHRYAVGQIGYERVEEHLLGRR